MTWLKQIDRFQWHIFVDEKGTSEELNHPGREASTYLQWIVDHYDRCQEDEVIFCQANPFNHCPDFLNQINDPQKNYFGEIVSCNSIGMPHCDWTPLHAWCEVFGLPKLDTYSFVAGAQYRVCDENILSRPHDFWKALLSLTKIRDKRNMSAWVTERLWPILLGIEL
jgi:hypothetical protein